MGITEDYLKQAEKLLFSVFKDERPQLLSAFGNAEHDLKEDNTVVTKMDKNMEKSIRTVLRKFDRGVGIEGEELGIEGSRKTFWLVDPIDGTEAFIRGLPDPRNMATLIDNGEPVFCIVYKFVTDELFIARKGKGATRNGQPIQVSDRPLNRSWIEYGTDLMDPKSAKRYLALRPHVNTYTIMKDFTPIAIGGYEGGIWDQHNGGPWDYAPRALLIKEAGGVVANVGSDKYDYKIINLIATNARIFDELHKLYKEN
ncbi:MAG TPA: inositol monophosphatase [Patescibacteria group bacterium]|nr:inositol monophosphatase [Patescibacteria group bacterium]